MLEYRIHTLIVVQLWELYLGSLHKNSFSSYFNVHHLKLANAGKKACWLSRKIALLIAGLIFDTDP